MKIQARIAPNDRKYYGTTIELENEEGTKAEFQVWVNGIGDYTPSEREYDVEKDGRFYVEEDGELYEYEICDDHYETAAALKICKKIVEAINGIEI